MLVKVRYIREGEFTQVQTMALGCVIKGPARLWAEPIHSNSANDIIRLLASENL